MLYYIILYYIMRSYAILILQLYYNYTLILIRERPQLPRGSRAWVEQPIDSGWGSWVKRHITSRFQKLLTDWASAFSFPLFGVSGLRNFRAF